MNTATSLRGTEPAVVQDSLTVVVNQSMHEMRRIEERLQTLFDRLSSNPQTPETGKQAAGVVGAIEASNEIRNSVSRIHERITVLENIL